MADPLSIFASAIAVATLAYDSVKTLHELFTSIRDAPKTIRDINADLSEISTILLSFTKELDRIKCQAQPQTLSPELEACLTEVQPAMQACAAACDVFKTKMQAITSHSTAQRTSFRDRLKLHFRDADIASFKYRLGSYKSTLNVALAFASMKSTAKNVDAVKGLESTIEKNVNIIIGQIQGLEIGLSTVQGGEEQKKEVVDAMVAQMASLSKCVQVCVAAMEGATKVTGNEVKSIEIRDRARVAAGVFAKIEQGGAQYAIGKVIAQDDARGLVGVASGADVLAFLK